MKRKFTNLLIFITSSFAILLFIGLIARQAEKNKSIQPLYGYYISKSAYSVWNDWWPFTIDEATIYCTLNDGKLAIFIEDRSKFYSLNDVSKEQMGLPLPTKIWKSYVKPILVSSNRRANASLDRKERNLVITRAELKKKYGAFAYFLKSKNSDHELKIDQIKRNKVVRVLIQKTKSMCKFKKN